MKEIAILSFITSIIFAIPTLIISAIVAWIAIRQYQTNKRQQLVNEERFKLDLFDKRFKVFESTRGLFQKILEHGNVDSQETRNFRLLTMDAIFLFNDEIHDYLEKIVHMKALRLNKIVKEYKPLPEGTKEDKLHEERVEIVDWFRDEYFELQNMFSPYLKFEVLKEPEHCSQNWISDMKNFIKSKKNDK